MSNIVDGNNNWPCHLDGVTNNSVEVTMDGKNGYDAVCTGLPRAGSVEDNGISYQVQLPGTFTPHSLKVSFKRV